MPKYRRKPIVVEAEQYLPGQQRRDPHGVHPANVREEAPRPYVITAHGQRVYIESGDWIIAEPDNRGFYPCKDDIFRATYEPASESVQ